MILYHKCMILKQETAEESFMGKGILSGIVPVMEKMLNIAFKMKIHLRP